MTILLLCGCRKGGKGNEGKGGTGYRSAYVRGWDLRFFMVGLSLSTDLLLHLPFFYIFLIP